MKVLLIQPSTFRKNYGEYADAGGKSQPLGISYLAAFLEKNNITTEILDADVLGLTIQQTLDAIAESNPDVIGISVLTTTFFYVKNLAREIKKIFPFMFIIVGGPHITAMPEESLQSADFDIGVIGEGEISFLAIIESIFQIKRNANDIKMQNAPKEFFEKLACINGIVYKCKKNIIKTKARNPILNLDDMPFPAYHLLPSIKLYRPQIHSMKTTPISAMISSRGCPFQCVFCDKSVFGSKYRVRSPKNVVDEMESHKKKYNVKEITFFDDNFALLNNRVFGICEEILKRKLDIYWSCSVRVDSIDESILKIMKDAGCWMIAIGIESGNENVLKMANKGISLEMVKNVVKWSNKYNIKVRGFFILGLPGETKESINDTIRFAKSLNLNTAEFTICTPFPNTPLYHNISKYGELDNSDLSKFSQMFPVFTPKGLSREYLIKKQREAHRKFYLRPLKIIDFALQIRSLNDIKRYWTGFKIIAKGFLK